MLQEIGIEQEQAAQTLGANAWQTFRRITVPAIRWGVAYGVVLTTARVLGEFGAVSVVSGSIFWADPDPAALRREAVPTSLPARLAPSVLRLPAALLTLLTDEPPTTPGRQLMGIAVEAAYKNFSHFQALADVSLDGRGRVPDRAARAKRLRQVDLAARDRRARDARRGPGANRRPRRFQETDAKTRSRLRISALRGLQAHDRLRKRRLRAEDPQMEEGEDLRPRPRAAKSGPACTGSRTATPPSSPRGAAPADGAGARPCRRAAGSTTGAESRSARSTPRYARTCALGCATCTRRCTSRRSSSHTNKRRQWMSRASWW